MECAEGSSRSGAAMSSCPGFSGVSACRQRTNTGTTRRSFHVSYGPDSSNSERIRRAGAFATERLRICPGLPGYFQVRLEFLEQLASIRVHCTRPSHEVGEMQLSWASILATPDRCLRRRRLAMSAWLVSSFRRAAARRSASLFSARFVVSAAKQRSSDRPRVLIRIQRRM